MKDCLMTASILTNTSAMVALQTLKNTNSNLQEVNSQISTGKKVANAKDNAAVFAISEVMEADVAGFQAVSDSLSLGQSTLGVASNAAESVGELLNEIKGKVVAANEDNVDRQKLQNEIGSLRDQINGIVSSAQFNGLNLIDGSTNATGFSVLSSLDRDASGNVTTNSVNLTTANTDLSTTTGTDVSAAATTNTDPGTAGVLEANDGGTNDRVQFGSFSFLDNAGGATGGAALSADTAGVDSALTGGLVAGDSISVTLGANTARYVVGEGDTTNDLASGIRQALIDAGVNQDDFTLDTTAAAGELQIVNNTETDVAYNLEVTRGSGGLAGLDSIDVSTAAGAQAALSNIEGYIQTAVDAQAALGTTEKRLGIQSDFMSSLIDSFEAGIGSLVDADLEEASARLQALQVQQQLGTQALSIANQQPQNLLALFR
jgi:flagellin